MKKYGLNYPDGKTILYQYRPTHSEFVHDTFFSKWNNPFPNTHFLSVGNEGNTQDLVKDELEQVFSC